MLEQPTFEKATFHTAYLDELLQQRRGEPFENPREDEEIAAVAAALQAVVAVARRSEQASRSARAGDLARIGAAACGRADGSGWPGSRACAGDVRSRGQAGASALSRSRGRIAYGRWSMGAHTP